METNRLQEAYNNMPAELKGQLLKGYTRQWEDRLILYTMEQDKKEIYTVMVEAGIPDIKLCKKCYSRGYIGTKDGVPVLCNCIYKNLSKRIEPLKIDWRGNGEKADD